MQKKLDEAKRLHAEALELRRQLVGDPDVDLPAKVDAITSLADSLDSLEQFDESLALRTRIFKMYEKEEKKHDFGSSKRRAVKEHSFPYREALCWTYQKAAFNAGDYATRKKYLIKADEMSEELMRERRTSRNILLRWASLVKIFGELEYNHGKLAEKDGNKDAAAKFYDGAEKHYKRLNDISRRLATSNELIDGIRDYSRSFYTLGLAEQVKKNPTKARQYFEVSRGIRERTLADYSDSAISAHLQIDLFFSQIALGELSRTMEVAENMVWAFKDEADAEYRLACVFALAIDTVEENRKPDPLTLADKRLQNRFRRNAIRCLQLAHDGGFTDFFQTSIDADLDALRGDPSMKEFEASHAYRLGVQAKKRRDMNKAHAHFEKSQELARQFIKALPVDARVKHVKIEWLCAEVHLGRVVKAIEVADNLRPTLGKRSPTVFLLARVYSLACGATADAKLREQYRKHALDLLEKAGDIATEPRLVAEDDLDPIRDDPRFRVILDRAKQRKN
ncbi:MAG: hypothetical protein HYX68_04200 [Planctomycetes bacterium]|nr:hypothetical protein [Planctomycetota bacterium]